MRGITPSILTAVVAAASLAGGAAAADLGGAGPVSPPAPAASAPSRMYVVLRGGFAAAEDTTLDTLNTRIETAYDNGAAASAGLGFHLDTLLGEAAGLRAEMEAGYVTHDVKAHSGAGLASKGATAGGSIGTTFAVVSLYYDFLPTARITPFIGAGAGIAQQSFDRYVHGAQGVILDDRSTDWFYHGTAGLTFKVTPRWQVEAAYRLTSVPSASPANVEGNRQQMHVSDQMVLVGARAHF